MSDSLIGHSIPRLILQENSSVLLYCLIKRRCTGFATEATFRCGSGMARRGSIWRLVALYEVQPWLVDVTALPRL